MEKEATRWGGYNVVRKYNKHELWHQWPALATGWTPCHTDQPGKRTKPYSPGSWRDPVVLFIVSVGIKEIYVIKQSIPEYFWEKRIWPKETQLMPPPSSVCLRKSQICVMSPLGIYLLIYFAM